MIGMLLQMNNTFAKRVKYEKEQRKENVLTHLLLLCIRMIEWKGVHISQSSINWFCFLEESSDYILIRLFIIQFVIFHKYHITLLFHSFTMICDFDANKN